MEVLFTVVHPPPKGVKGLVYGDGSDDSLYASLEAVLGQPKASQLRQSKEKKVWRYLANRVVSGSSLCLHCLD
jgi:hypothetical protein